MAMFCDFVHFSEGMNTGLRVGLDLELGLKNGLGWKKSTPLIGREVGTRLFKFTPWFGAN